MTLSLPAVWMRGGTSKGLFVESRDLPPPGAERDRLLLRALGSPDPFRSQMDGMGGGTSSTSKVAVVERAGSPDADISFLFGHVAIDRPLIDWSGTCGNLIAAVALYAVERGWARAESVRIELANDGGRVDASVPLHQGRPAVPGTLKVAGVPALDGEGHAAIRIRYRAQPGRPPFPTGNVRQRLALPDGTALDATLVDFGNPTVFVAAHDLGLAGTELPAELDAVPGLGERIEVIRACAALAMGLVDRIDAAAARPATPKVAMLAPAATHACRDGSIVNAADADLVARIWSMGRAHHAFTGTGAVALAACMTRAATLPSLMAGGTRDTVRFAHPGGVMRLGSGLDPAGQPWVETLRSARRLMQGEVLIPAGRPEQQAL